MKARQLLSTTGNATSQQIGGAAVASVGADNDWYPAVLTGKDDEVTPVAYYGYEVWIGPNGAPQRVPNGRHLTVEQPGYALGADATYDVAVEPLVLVRRSLGRAGFAAEIMSPSLASVTQINSCEESFVGIDLTNCLTFTVTQGVNKCATQPADGNERELAWDAARGDNGRWVATTMFQSADGDTEFSMEYEDDGVSLNGFLNSENVTDRKMRRMGCVGRSLQFSTYDPVYCTATWTTECYQCETAPRFWTVDYEALGEGSAAYTGLYTLDHTDGCDWSGPGDGEDQQGDLTLAYDPEDELVYNVLTFSLGGGGYIRYHYRGLMCCGPKTFTYFDSSGAGTAANNIPATVTVNALGPCGPTGCSHSLFSVFVKCKTCDVIMCDEVGPLPRTMCVQIPSTPDRPPPVGNAYACGDFGYTFDPVDVVFGAAFEGDFFTPGAWFPATHPVSGLPITPTGPAPSRSGNLRSWVGTGVLHHYAWGDLKFGLELYLDDEDCAPRGVIWLPFICFGVAQAGGWGGRVDPYAFPFGPAEALPPLGTFPVTLSVGTLFRFSTGCVDSQGLNRDLCNPFTCTTVTGNGTCVGSTAFYPELDDIVITSGACAGPSPPPPPPPPPPPTCCDGSGESLETHPNLEIVIPDGPNAGTYIAVWDVGASAYVTSLPGEDVEFRMSCVEGEWSASVVSGGSGSGVGASSASCDPFALVFPGAMAVSAGDITVSIA